MPILAFQKPDKVVMLESNDFRGVFEFRPLEPGYGITIGNALRRILISSLDGYAITSVRIEGVEHEFSTIKGVVEDVTEIVLNLKQVRFRNLKGEDEINNGETITVNINGKDTFTAGDLSNELVDFEVLNPDLVICNLDTNAKVTFELAIKKGRGYVPAEENKVSSAVLGTIFIDSIFTPMKNVKYSVENYRVEQKTDYEKLIFEIDTDGSISPKDALKDAANILIHHFLLFSDEKITKEIEQKSVTEELDEDTLYIKQLLRTKLVDLDLSVRALNCLKSAEMETLSELVAMSRAEVARLRNFGKKSLTELDELLANNNLHFGMNVAKYFKNDKD
jgi:DNA-directed RNA polymerase subunit alpha